MAMASAVGLFLTHLIYPHPPSWVAYYLEVFPLFHVAAAAGLVEALNRARVERSVRLALLAPALVMAVTDVYTAHVHRQRWQAHVANPQRVWASIPEAQAIVFVRFGPSLNLAFGLVRNSANLPAERIWAVRDRGERNEELRRHAPHRAAYLYETESMRLTKLN